MNARIDQMSYLNTVPVDFSVMYRTPELTAGKVYYNAIASSTRERERNLLNSHPRYLRPCGENTTCAQRNIEMSETNRQTFNVNREEEKREVKVWSVCLCIYLYMYVCM